MKPAIAFLCRERVNVRVQNKNAAERLKMPFSAAGKNKRRRPSPAAPCRTKKKDAARRPRPDCHHFMHLRITATGKMAIKNKIYNTIIKNHSFASLYLPAAALSIGVFRARIKAAKVSAARSISGHFTRSAIFCKNSGVKLRTASARVP